MQATSTMNREEISYAMSGEVGDLDFKMAFNAVHYSPPADVALDMILRSRPGASSGHGEYRACPVCRLSVRLGRTNTNKDRQNREKKLRAV